MLRGIRRNLTQLLAVTVMAVAGVLTLFVVLQEQRVRIPLLEQRPFEIKAEFETAQAVVPGQGQTIRVAGVRVGDVSGVQLEDGKAVITFAIDREFLPVYKDATILMRPSTALKDMFFELDPGTQQAGVAEEDYTVPLANTAPDVNLDEILSTLDGDTQSYLRLLIVGAGGGLDGNAQQLGRLLRELGPLNRDLDRLSSSVARRRRDVAHLIHNLQVLTGAVARQDDDVTSLVSASDAALGAIASQSPDLERAVELLPGTLVEGRKALDQLGSFAAVAGPAATALRPFAQRLERLDQGLITLGRTGTPALRDQIRPFVRAARAPTSDLRDAAQHASRAAPKLTAVGTELNKVLNTAAYNPRGAEPAGTPGRDEGYLYWVAWLGHTGDHVFNAQDAHGLFRRIYFTASCANFSSFIASAVSSADLYTLASNAGLGALFQAGGPCNP